MNKQAGKGDKPRKYSKIKWDNNYDQINFKSKEDKCKEAVGRVIKQTKEDTSKL